MCCHVCGMVHIKDPLLLIASLNKSFTSSFSHRTDVETFYQILLLVAILYNNICLK